MVMRQQLHLRPHLRQPIKSRKRNQHRIAHPTHIHHRLMRQRLHDSSFHKCDHRQIKPETSLSRKLQLQIPRPVKRLTPPMRPLHRRAR